MKSETFTMQPPACQSNLCLRIINSQNMEVSLVFRNICHGQLLLPRLFNHSIQTGVTLLRVPRTWTTLLEHLFDLLERLAASFGISEVELDGGEHTHAAKHDEHAPLDVDKTGRDVEAKSLAN